MLAESPRLYEGPTRSAMMRDCRNVALQRTRIVVGVILLLLQHARAHSRIIVATTAARIVVLYSCCNTRILVVNS